MRENNDDADDDDDDATDAKCRLNGKLLGKCVRQKRALENYQSIFNMLSKLDGITVNGGY